MKNWKTTLIGASIGVAYFILTAVQNGMNVKDALIGGGLILLGLVSKDFDVSGNKTVNTEELQKKVDDLTTK
jgi:hypothetical protein